VYVLSLLSQLRAETYNRGVYAAIAGFLLYSSMQLRDGPFIRPHPGPSV
jgi:hypothetical protein